MATILFPQHLRATAFAPVVTMIGAALFAGNVFAQSRQTDYLDVESGAWYEGAARALLDMGALDSNETYLRPHDLATRAEVIKLLVRLNDRTLQYPARSSFTDIATGAWYFPYFESAAKAGWVRGDNNCYGRTPCTARPNDRLNRAEAATLIIRSFALPGTGRAPRFVDNTDTSAWYYTTIQAAADHCILEGDDMTGRVRPASFMNRAEMISMFHRAAENLTYGEDCGAETPAGEITSAAIVGPRTIRINFSEDLDENTADDASRYQLTRGSQDIDVTDADVIDDDAVEITLASNLITGVTYRLAVTNLRTDNNERFNDAINVHYSTSTTARITGVTFRRNDTVRVTFDTDLERVSADDMVHYAVERVSGGGLLDIDNVVLIDGRTVDIVFKDAVQPGVAYRLTATDLRTESGGRFSATSASFSRGSAASGSFVGVSVQSASRIRLHFSTGLERTRAEEETRYRVSGQNGDITVGEARLIDDSMVELLLGSTLSNQEIYTVTITDLQTTGGVHLSGTQTFLYGSNNIGFVASLLGSKEVPSVTTTKSGTGTFTLTRNGLKYDITIRGFTGSSSVTAAHFHLGAEGVSGDVIEPITFNGNMRATGTWTDLTAQERDDLLDGRVYVNVHSTAYPNGEIRGQITRN